uniref:TFIIS N-terminal domain-containing protein n=2 Tax=Kalanchoe fedtschenkoi TaxID=63787 RepID=A0A7N0TYU6_KALFE
MGFEDDRYRDEDGEPVIDFDDQPSDDGGRSPEPLREDDLVLDDDDEEEEERSRTPLFDPDKATARPRKRLVKKGGVDDGVGLGFGLEDEDGGEYNPDGGEREYFNQKRKAYEREGGESSRKNEERFKGDRDRGKGVVRRGMVKKSSPSGKGGRSRVDETEMWNTVAGGDSEDDQEVRRTVDDDNFIDDSGVDPSDRYGSDHGGHSPSHYPQAEEGEEDDEIKELFKMGKKKKKNERSAAEIALLVENVMAELEVTAEEDAELNRQNKPAINKLKKLPLLTDVLMKKQLQQEFLDHGVLTLLKNWLEPLPDGSLPSINVREAVLRILTDFPIDLENESRRDQLKRSGLGKVIMFLSKSDEETTSNRKLAKDLVDKWSRPIFNKSTRFEDMRNLEEDRAPYRRPAAKKSSHKSGGLESRDDDLDLPRHSQGSKQGESSARSLTTRPEAMSLDFTIRPQSKIDPEAVRARAKQNQQDQRRMKMNKKLQQLKAPKKKNLQASKISVEGRGMVKYLNAVIGMLITDHREKGGGVLTATAISG